MALGNIADLISLIFIPPEYGKLPSDRTGECQTIARRSAYRFSEYRRRRLLLISYPSGGLTFLAQVALGVLLDHAFQLA